MTDFTDLLQEAERLTTDLEGTMELPKVERSLKQVLEASNALYSRVSHTGSDDVQANMLLAPKGIDLTKIVQKLDSISNLRTLDLKPADADDVENRLKKELKRAVLRSFDLAYNKMLESTRKNCWEEQESEWEEQKLKILNVLGGREGGPIEIGLNQSIITERPVVQVTQMGPNESIYATKILQFNNELIKGLPKQNLVNTFFGISNEFKDAKVKDMWEIIKYMVQLSPFPQSEDPISGRNSAPVIRDLVGQGKKYLEDRYKTFMNNIVNENLAVAGRGGIPGTYPLVRSFVGLRLQGEYAGLKDGSIDDRPLWPMVYYCLRAGDFAAALYCMKKTTLTEYSEITEMLETKLKNPASPDISKLEDRIRFSYRRFVRNETDPFKRIIWAVLGCCDVTDEHSEVARTADDYLWLKLNLVRVDFNKEDFIKYNELQQVILEEYGETHYDAFNQPHLYFQVLALSGQFEAAIEFLARIERFRVHAVHMAMALNELYLIAIPNDINTPLLIADPADPKPARRLNLARLIVMYVKTFQFNCVNEALNYFYHLKTYTDVKGENLFKISVADLALETKEYEKILGRVQPNGVRLKGLIDQFTDIDVAADSIAELIGRKLIDNGLLEEAIDIFDIANNQEEILTLLCSLLSQVVEAENEPDSLRDRLKHKAVVLAERFTREGYKCSVSLVNSFLKLKDLLSFFDLYHAKEYPQALKLLNDLQIVPFKDEDITDRVKSFSGFTAEVCKLIPDVLLATMNMIFSNYQRIKSNTEYIPRYQDSSVELQLTNLRHQAKALTNFAALLPYRMPGDTNSRLMQLEILMH